MEYLDTPTGKMRIPEQLREARFTDGWTIAWKGSGVDLYFTQTDPEPGSIGEVVGHVFMSLDQLVRLPRELEIVLEAIDPQDEPGI